MSREQVSQTIPVSAKRVIQPMVRALDRVDRAMSRRGVGALLLTLFVGSVFVGCTEKVEETQIDAEAKLRPLARMYSQFMNLNNRRPPKDEKQFREFLERFGQEALAGRTIDDFLTSDRDKQPFVVSYGRVRVTSQGARIIAYEKEGVDGERYIADDLGVIEKVDQERFKQLVPDG